MIINIFLWGFLINQLYKNNYPENYELFITKYRNIFNSFKNKTNNNLINIGYKSLYLYSIIQIKMFKVLNFFYPYYRTITNKFKKDIKTMIEFYSNGKLIKKFCYSFHYNQCFISNLIKPDDYDLIIATDMSSDEIKMTTIADTNDFIKFANSSARFVSIECIYDNKNYTIELKTDKYNFYTENTIINDNFIKYYLINILNLKEDNLPKNIKYTLNIIDNSINCHTLNETQYIQLAQKDYIIGNKPLNSDK
jgi:hypothetical protein